jgi:hypothetical protein
VAVVLATEAQDGRSDLPGLLDGRCQLIRADAITRRSGKSMTTRLEVLRNGTVCRQETLRMTRRFKPLHPPLSLSRRLM